MASVWRVNDEVSGREVALKRLTASAATAHVVLFEREYHTLATLNHPCIVRAFDYAADDAGPLYTMELLVGSDSSARAPLPFQEVCRILRDLAEAIGLLHARRLIHRDLSARNVWMMPDGTIKLIDFGAMTTFGKTDDVAGTPPFIAPESLHARQVDQRTDLYALGALGYYLLTGRHAFPARTLIELTGMWAERPLPVSKRVADLGRADLPAVPVELETLIDSLLSHDPLARPTTAADVISRLTTIGGLPQTKDRQIAESYLTSPAFVGRSSERAILRHACAAVGKGQAGQNTIMLESPVGLGRTRLLSELSLELSFSGVTVLHAQPDGDRATHSAAQKYASELLNALHEKALNAARPYASTLAHLSPALRERLGVERLAEMPAAHGEARMRVQTALRDWFLELARDQTIVIIADDFDQFDEASAAWLVGLVHGVHAHRLLVVASVTSGVEAEAAATKALRRHARVLTLAPLTPSEMLTLFRSVFGDAQHLQRLVDVVQQRSEGNPGHALDLAEHLTREGVVALEEGTWILPQSLPATALPSSRLAAELARLARLPEPARQLGQTLSVRVGSMSLAMCSQLSEISGHALFTALEALVREGVLIGADGGYRFTRDSIREHLYAELNAERKRRAHRQLGQFLLQLDGASALERLHGGVQLLLGDDDESGSVAVAEAGRHYGLVQLADLGPATDALETALAQFRARGRPRHELVLLLAPLALGGYYSDRRLALRYGWEAVDALQHVVGLHRARRLRPFLGRKLSLLVGLLPAAIMLGLQQQNPRVPSFREAMMLLFNCVAALTGVCTICLDPEAGMRYASVIEPMTALGPKHVASFMHRFCLNLVATISDDQARACDQWREMIAQLDDPHAPSNLPANIHALYLGGALYARGAIECYRDDSHALECAERLDSLQLKLYDMSADQIRMSYYANRGNREQFEHFRQRVEMHAIQRGTAWQVETWKHHALLTVYLRTGDVAGLKECVQQLKRLRVEIPSLEGAYIAALGAYHVLRGKPSAALDLLDKEATPDKVLGIGRLAGVRARAHNALGQPSLAKQISLEALARLSADDRKFCALNLAVEIELARAEAGLGAFETAEQQLRALLELHTPAGNPLTLGALFEALAEVAALRDDHAAFEACVHDVARYFRTSRDPALVARHQRLERVATMLASTARGPDSPSARSPLPARLMTVVHLLEHGGERSLQGSAEWAIRQLTDLTQAEAAFLFMAQDTTVRCLASTGDTAPSDEIKRFVANTLASLREADEDAEDQTVATDAVVDLTRVEAQGKVFQVNLLRAPAQPANENSQVIGAVVTSGGSVVPAGVLQAIGARLAANGEDFTSV